MRSSHVINQELLKTQLSVLIERYHSQFTVNEKLFLERVFGKGLDAYVKRLEAINFVQQKKILDAGCGWGQWALALASMNEHVDACDLSRLRISFLRDMLSSLGIANLSAQESALDELPYSDNYLF